MDREMRATINELAQDVIDIFHIKVPIASMEDIVRKMGGDIVEDDSVGMYSDGYIEKVPQKDQGKCSFKIVIPSSQPPNRKNFTIAHELGHLFLHMGFMIDESLWNANCNQSFNRKGDSEIEWQANEFAAALLMPKDQYKEALDRHTEGEQVSVSKIAEYFHVSADAASCRGKWLGYLEW